MSRSLLSSEQRFTQDECNDSQTTRDKLPRASEADPRHAISCKLIVRNTPRHDCNVTLLKRFQLMYVHRPRQEVETRP
jgi:hypothetical protein